MDAAEDESRPPEPAYVTLYRTHLAHTQAHLAGNDGLDLPYSHFPPSSYWYPEEKNAFFHALSIHSRLRPDLISECIQTKSIADVTTYIEALEDATTRASGVDRSHLPAAREVSQEWIDAEERMAGPLTVAESHWEAHTLAGVRDAEMRARIKEYKASHPRVDQKSRRMEYKQVRDVQSKEWEKEDLLHGFDMVYLQAMDRVLRDEEETHLTSALNQQDGDGSAAADALPILEEDNTGDAPVPLPELQSTPISTAETLGNADAGPSTTMPSTIAHDPTPALHAPNSVLPDNLSPGSRRRLQKRLYMRRKRAQLTGTEFSAEATRLKPGRKGKKAKNQVGKLSRENKGKKKAEEESNDEIDVDEEDSMGAADDATVAPTNDNSDRTHHLSLGGITRPYKASAKLQELGISAQSLQEDGLGLFHLSTLGRLMGMYGMLHDVPPEVNSEISAEVIRLLHAHVVAYTTELVHYAVASREQEGKLKVHTKVWRLAREQLVPANVEHAIEMMGVTRFDRKAHFTELLSRFDMDEEKQGEEVQAGLKGRSEGEDESCPEEEDTDDARDEKDVSLRDEDEPPLLPSLGLYRQVHAPFVHLPQSLSSDADPTLSFPKNRLASTSATASVSPFEGRGQLLPLEMDDAALATELLEEEALDVQDCVAEADYEAELWTKFSRGAGQV